MIALLSVTDKTGIRDLAEELIARGYKILATSGTARELSGLPVTEAGDYSGVGEILGGRVKTLSPKILAGILSRRTPEDTAECERLSAEPIDIVVCNLYTSGEIDIGGVTLIRAAAKNHEHVAVIVDPSDYAALFEQNNLESRKKWAEKAWECVVRCDAARIPNAPLRYGENPHQSARWWKFSGGGLHDARVIGGKELSYNNILDASAAFALVDDLGPGAAAVIKHQNPCGAAVGQDAVRRAIDADRPSAFGGVIAINGIFDAAAAAAFGDLFVEVVIARKIVAEWKKNTRLIEWPNPKWNEIEYRSVPGGMLSQTRDVAPEKPWRVVSKRQPTEAEMQDLKIAEIIARHVRSNAIVLVKDGVTVGIGAGQMNRADAVDIAARKGGDRRHGAGGRAAVMASDALIPFADGIENARGVTAVVEPGGSIRDEEVIAAADRLGIALVFSGVRHFKH